MTHIGGARRLLASPVMAPPRTALLLLPLLALGGCPAEPGAGVDDDDSAVAPAERLLFAFPVAEPWLINLVVGFDHDGVVDDGGGLGIDCSNYDGVGFPYCYDGHDGSDFILEGAFSTMDDGSAQVIAAAPGTVVSTEEDQYDRCHIEGTEVSCDGFPIVANHVIVEHDDGTRTKYWHLMKDSVEVEVDDVVACGDFLGLIGSSGISSMPHLHFEVQLGEGGPALDPYAGPESQPESWWTEQDGPFDVPGADCQ